MKPQALLLAAMLLTGATIGTAQVAADGAASRSYFSSTASYRAAAPVMLERNYLSCLNSGNDGIVESAIAHLAKMKLELPASSFPQAQEALRKLSLQGRSWPIRYKAFLAGMVFDNAEMFRLTGCENCKTPEALFASIAARMQETALSAR